MENPQVPGVQATDFSSPAINHIYKWVYLRKNMFVLCEPEHVKWFSFQCKVPLSNMIKELYKILLL